MIRKLKWYIWPESQQWSISFVWNPTSKAGGLHICQEEKWVSQKENTLRTERFRPSRMLFQGDRFITLPSLPLLPASLLFYLWVRYSGQKYVGQQPTKSGRITPFCRACPPPPLSCLGLEGNTGPRSQWSHAGWEQNISIIDSYEGICASSCLRRLQRRFYMHWEFPGIVTSIMLTSSDLSFALHHLLASVFQPLK